MKMAYEKRKSMYGYCFIALWFIGALIFFLIPVVESLFYSFREVSPDTGGMVGPFVGLDNYNYAFNVDPNYRQYLVKVLKDTAWKTPLILVFSLFVAVILNQKFKGRTFSRAVFFLPVIIATGPVYNIINGNLQSTGNSDASQFSTMFSTDLLGQLMEFLGIYGISDSMQTTIETVSDNIFGIVWNSGIQILIFLAALQNIPVSAKEAAQMEGATAWEYFWKITLPLIRPILVYVMITSMIGGLQMFDVPQILTNGKGGPDRTSTTMIMYLNNHLFSKNYGMAGAVSVVLFLVCAVLCVVVYFSLTKEDDGLTRAQRKELNAAKKAAKGGK